MIDYSIYNPAKIDKQIEFFYDLNIEKVPLIFFYEKSMGLRLMDTPKPLFG